MNRLIFCLPVLTLFLIGGSVVCAQKVTKVPLNEVLPMIAVQDDSPLKIECVAVVLTDDKRYMPVYRVKNVSSKNVTGYRIARFFDLGTGVMEYGVMPSSKVLKGGQTVGTLDSVEYSKNPTGYTGRLKAIALVMVVDVTFEDGTSFSAEKLYDTFTERLASYRIEK